MRSYFMRMFQYAVWADRRTLASLCATAKAQAEALPLLSHLLAAEHIWLSRLEQRPSCYPVWPTLTVEECKSLASENESGYRTFLEQLTENQMNTPIRYCNSEGREFQTSIIDILTQVVTHGPYHRGQIAKAIARNGGTSVNTDFITFVRETSPNT